jgi:hypothetical protein
MMIAGPRNQTKQKPHRPPDAAFSMSPLKPSNFSILLGFVLFCFYTSLQKNRSADRQAQISLQPATVPIF